MSEAVREKKLGIRKIWMPIVLITGVLLGVLSSLLTPIPEEERPELFQRLRFFPPAQVLMFHVMLTTIEIVLLVALVVVYMRVYRETKANFALGLIIVLGALLLHTILSYPLLISLVGPVPVGPGAFLPFADIFTIGAYAVFLYLSLE